MKRILILIAFVLIPLSVLSYTPNIEDKTLIEKFQSAIDNLYEEKPVHLNLFVDKADELLEGLDPDSRGYYIIDILQTYAQSMLEEHEEPVEQAFSKNRLMTNTAKSSINIEDILDGGPGKDGIPSLNFPHYTSIEDVDFLKETSRGILVVVGDIARFYPFNIMNWHEIVNDTFGGKALSITFCPLCGTSIVFDRQVDGETLTFGVSGKLYQSNLLMYDTKTESLWSQTMGQAVVGEMNGTELVIYDSDVISFEQFQELYPDGEVLSKDTGYRRSYSVDSPYGDYDDNDILIFPVNNDDIRLQKKEILFVVEVDGTSVAFVRQALVEAGEAYIVVDGMKVTASHEDGTITVVANDQELAGFHEMWFSWINKHPGSKYIWGIE